MSAILQNPGRQHRPAFPGDNSADLALMDSKPFGEFLLGNGTGQPSNVLNVLLGQSVMPARPSLSSFVSHIFTHRAKPKVLRIDAKGVVTSVADVLSCWNLPVMDYPTNAVSKFPSVRKGSLFNLPVTHGEAGTRPDPARVGFFNVSPKPLNDSFGKSKATKNNVHASRYT